MFQKDDFPLFPMANFISEMSLGMTVQNPIDVWQKTSWQKERKSAQSQEGKIHERSIKRDKKSSDFSEPPGPTV